MKITVVVPTFNEEEYIQKTLDSISRLNRKPDELIVIDGGSTDNTLKIAKKYKAKIFVEKRRLIGAARQLGLKMAKGDIVAYTDADSTVPKNWLTKIEEVLSLPDIVGVYGSFRVTSGWWVYRIYINYIQPSFNKLYSLVKIPMAPGQNMALLKKDALSVGGFPENFKIGEDMEMMRRLSAKGKIISLPKLIVHSSGRRGKEGPKLIVRVLKYQYYYVFFKKGNVVGFPDIR